MIGKSTARNGGLAASIPEIWNSEEKPPSNPPRAEERQERSRERKRGGSLLEKETKREWCVYKYATEKMEFW